MLALVQTLLPALGFTFQDGLPVLVHFQFHNNYLQREKHETLSLGQKADRFTFQGMRLSNLHIVGLLIKPRFSTN